MIVPVNTGEFGCVFPGMVHQAPSRSAEMGRRLPAAELSVSVVRGQTVFSAPLNVQGPQVKR